MIAKAKKIGIYWTLYNHMCNCSCYACGNQRNNPWQSGDECLTMQERKANEKQKIELEMIS